MKNFLRENVITIILRRLAAPELTFIRYLRISATLGYIITEYICENQDRFYSGMHINELGTSDYKRVFEGGPVKPIEYARSIMGAAICKLADLDDFEKIKIDLTSLRCAKTVKRTMVNVHCI